MWYKGQKKLKLQMLKTKKKSDHLEYSAYIYWSNIRVNGL